MTIEEKSKKKKKQLTWSSIGVGVLGFCAFMGWSGTDILNKYQKWGETIESVDAISKVLGRDTVKLKETLLMLKVEMDSVKAKKGGNAKKIFPALKNITQFLLEEMKEVRIGNILLYLDEQSEQHYHLYNGLLYEAYITPSRKIYWIDWNRKERRLN